MFLLLYVHDTVGDITNMAVLTFADCPVASVARLTGAAVASDHVKAQGVLIAVVEPAKAFVMLWKQKKNTSDAHSLNMTTPTSANIPATIKKTMCWLKKDG